MWTRLTWRTVTGGSAAGTLTEQGIDVDAAVAAVHASNLTKDAAGGGKAFKGPGYQEPDMDAVVWPDGRPADFEAASSEHKRSRGMADNDMARAQAAWWAEREEAYQRRPEIQAEITRLQAEKDQAEAEIRAIENRMNDRAEAGRPGAQEALNEFYNHDALRTDPSSPSAKNDEQEWRAFYQRFEGRDLPLHAHDKAERHRIDASAPPDVGGMAAEYYEQYQPSIGPDELTAEWASITVEELWAERRRDELDMDAE
jgi:hypothetical protein